jgi:hypothetical protein
MGQKPWLHKSCPITYFRRDQPTKCTKIIYFFIYLYSGSYMFRQNNAILRERLFFLSEPLQRQYGRRQDIGNTMKPTYQRAIQWTEKVHYQVHTFSVLVMLSEGCTFTEWILSSVTTLICDCTRLLRSRVDAITTEWTHTPTHKDYQESLRCEEYCTDNEVMVTENNKDDSFLRFKAT